jgi:hypothetical protein
LTDRWQRSSDDYRADVERALARDVNVIATLDYDPANKPVNAVPQLRRALGAYAQDDS